MFSTKEIEHLYYNEKLSTQKVSEKLNCPRSLVQGRLKANRGLRSVSEALTLRSTPAYSEKIRATKVGNKNPQAKLNENQVLKIRDEYNFALEEGLPKTVTQNFLAKKYNIKRSTISDIVLRRTWKHI
ncbi:hypothetical protein [Oceanobacillus profundus]|uniref:hypothetical protein n=1 Tax=Oceanobacillus TaxID=182709 RepID=UPI0026E12EAF|nr:hypothetical protein [Oceanobacillus profundus]MDO6448108.1 hypothetical protein [Oceanobacillus profundus]